MLTINHLSQASGFSYNGNIRNYSCVYPANLGGYTQQMCILGSSAQARKKIKQTEIRKYELTSP